MNIVSHTPAEVVAALMASGRYFERPLFETERQISIFDTSTDENEDTTDTTYALRCAFSAPDLKTLALRGLRTLHVSAWCRVDETLCEYAEDEDDEDEICTSTWQEKVAGLSDPAAHAAFADLKRFESDAEFQAEVLDLLWAEYKAERAEYTPSNDILSISVDVGPDASESDESMINEYIPRLQAAIEAEYPDVDVTVNFVRIFSCLKVEFDTEDDEAFDEKLDDKEDIKRIAGEVMEAGWDD